MKASAQLDHRKRPGERRIDVASHLAPTLQISKCVTLGSGLRFHQLLCRSHSERKSRNPVAFAFGTAAGSFDSARMTVKYSNAFLRKLSICAFADSFGYYDDH